MCPLKIDVEILTLKVMELGGGAFGWWFGHEGKAFTNEISTIIKEASETALLSSTLLEHSKKTGNCEWWSTHQTISRPIPWS